MKSALTLTTVFVLFLGSIALGYELLTADADVEAVEPVTCEMRTLKAGDVISPNQVRVSSLNSSSISGLANRVLIDLGRHGFAPGTIANAEIDEPVRDVTILTDDPKHPAVRLLAAQFKDTVEFADPIDPDQEGLTVVLGQKYKGLKKKPPREAKLKEDLDWCVPVVVETEVEGS